MQQRVLSHHLAGPRLQAPAPLAAVCPRPVLQRSARAQAWMPRHQKTRKWVPQHRVLPCMFVGLASAAGSPFSMQVAAHLCCSRRIWRALVDKKQP